MEELADRVAVVTGAASGIGRALAECFAEFSMNVVIADIEEAALREAADAIGKTGASVLAVPTDVSDLESVQALAQETYDAFGATHVLCNNAGVFAAGLSWETPQSDYDWCFGVNVWGVMNGLRSFVPRMLAQGEPGHIVNTASMAALTAAPFVAAYYMTKHAVMGLTETLYYELQSKQAEIGVSVVCPELFNTGIAHYARSRRKSQEARDEGNFPERDVVEQAIIDATVKGKNPRMLAERIIKGIREGTFYILPEEEDPWRVACDARLEDIRLARNPTSGVPAD